MTQKGSAKPIGRSLWNRVVPVRVRHNIGLIFGSIIILIGVGIMLGTFQIRPIVFSEGGMLPSITNNIEGTVDLFDISVPHSISLEISDRSYDQMISDYEEFAEKTWIEVDAVIDGTLIRSVGIRLKGNSTLFALRGGFPGFGPPGEGGGGPGGFRGPDGAPDFGGPGEGDAPEGAPGFGGPEQGEAPEGAPGFGGPGGGAPGGFGGFGGPGGPPGIGSADAEDPSSLPFLLSFNEFFSGRGYQGRTELAIRPAAEGETSFNEALSLQLIKESGQVSQAYTWITLFVNDNKTATRLVLEHPEQNYAVGLGHGVLYKSRASNTFTYHGEDPNLYLEDIEQLSAIGTYDIFPVIGLLKWLDSVSDEDFDTELSQWVDVQSFAKYVVTHDLLGNFDDMAGPGHNFLLWYDLDDEIFTIITWDMNLALSGLGDGFAGLFGGDGPPGGGPPGGFSPGGGPPGGFRGGGPPGGFPGGEGRPRIGNTLKEKFEASEVFSIEIAKAREELLALWITSGRAVELISEFAQVVPVSDKLTAENIETDVTSLSATVIGIE